MLRGKRYPGLGKVRIVSYMTDLPSPDWYTDPRDPGKVRWWDGANWGEETRPHPSAQAASPAQAPTANPDSAYGQAPAAGWASPAGATDWQYDAPSGGAPGFPGPGAGPSTQVPPGWQGGSAGWQQPGQPAAPFPSGNSGWQAPGGPGGPVPPQRSGGRKLLYGGLAVVAVVVIVVVAVVLSRSGNSSSGGGNKNGGNGPSSNAAACAQVGQQIDSQLSGIASQASTDPSKAASLLQQASTSFHQAAQSVSSSDPQLSTALTNFADDAGNAATDINDGNTNKLLDTDLPKMESDENTINSLCGNG